MNWIKLEHLLLKAQPDRAITTGPALDHARPVSYTHLTLPTIYSV